MSENSGMNFSDVVTKLSNEDTMGVNFLTGETINLFESGVIDPVKVTRCALQNAASVAGTLITTNYAIIQ
jgi:chaperonin GroEL